MRPPEELSIAAHCGHVLFLLNQFISADQGRHPATTGAAAGPRAPSTMRPGRRCAAVCGMPTATWRRACASAASGPSRPSRPQLILLAHCNYHVGQVRQLLTYVAA